MVIGLSARADCNERMLRGTLSRLAASDQVRSWSSHRILNNVREERSQHDADGESQYCDVHLV